MPGVPQPTQSGSGDHQGVEVVARPGRDRTSQGQDGRRGVKLDCWLERVGDMEDTDTIKVTLVRSGIGRKKKIRETLKGLGLTRLNKTVELKNTPAIRGMIQKVSFLLRVD
jgi:large subunit ribosomal protein L30